MIQILDETDTPPLYSSISVAPPNRPTTGEPSESKATRRSSSRLSFSGMLNDVKGIMQGSPSRHIVDHDRVGFHTLERERTPEEGAHTRGRSRGRKDKGPMARIGEALGIDTHDDDDDNDDGDTDWKELKPGMMALVLALHALRHLQGYTTTLYLSLCLLIYNPLLKLNTEAFNINSRPSYIVQAPFQQNSQHPAL